MWICPVCECEIDSLDYSVEVRERGYVNLHNNDGSCETDNYESDDSEWVGDVFHSCPECNEEVSLSDLTLVTDKETAEKEEKEEEEKELEEEKHKIIKPEIKLQIERENINQTDSAMICKKCFYVFVYSTEKYGNDDSFTDCPNCGQQNSKQEYKKLIADRFFEKIKIKNLRKKHAKKTNRRRLKPMVRPR